MGFRATLGHRRRGFATVMAGLVVCSLGLAAPPAQAGALSPNQQSGQQPSYNASVVRTAGGIPNITAADFGSLGYGTGFAMAQDNVCLIADQMLTYSAQRSRFLGPQDGNLGSDFFYQLFIDRGEAQERVDPRQADVFRGAAVGYNRYLSDVGVANLPDPTCRGKSWVRPLSEIDFRRVSRMNFFLPYLLPQIVAATPPAELTPASTATARTASAQPPPVLSPTAVGNGSNGIAIGSEGTVDHTGMLLANPHLDWTGTNRFWAFHQTIPGVLNITGANVIGRPQVGFGATEHVAFTSTVQTGPLQSFYRVDLVPGHPTQYLFDGQPRDLKAETVTVNVRDGAGHLTPQSHTFYSTDYGALMVGGNSFPWSAASAFAVRATDVGWRGVDALLPEYQAKSVHELKAVEDKYQFLPNNVIAADSSGEAYYANVAPIPNLTNQQYAACATSGGVALDGSRSACMWNTDPDAAGPGIFGPGKLPSLIRKDFVTNSNDSYWLSNPRQPLTGFPASLGSADTERSMRTRSGLSQVLNRLAGTDGQSGRNFTLQQLEGLVMNDEAYTGQILRDGLVTLCENNSQVTLDGGTTVDISAACPVLNTWDLRDDLNSRGAVLFREFLIAAGTSRTLPASLNYVVPFDVNDPVNTPRGLNPTDNPNALKALAAAVAKLRDNGIPLDVPLGQIQYVVRNGVKIPIHGGTNAEGDLNIINAPFVPGVGYPNVVSGSSWIQATEYSHDGPVSQGVLTYSQSANPNSPHYADMTTLFSNKQMVNLPFSAQDVAAQATSTLNLTEPAATTTTVGASPNAGVGVPGVLLYASVAPSAAGGTVSFNSGDAVIPGCEARPVNADSASFGYATCVTTFAAAGVVTVTANYGGNATDVASSSSVPLTVTATPDFFQIALGYLIAFAHTNHVLGL